MIKKFLFEPSEKDKERVERWKKLTIEDFDKDDEMDALKDRIINELMQISMKDPSTSRQATFLIFIAHNLERIADRSTNIAEDTIFLVTGSSRELN